MSDINATFCGLLSHRTSFFRIFKMTEVCGMFAKVEGMDVYYERHDGVGTPVVLMHGWGCRVDTMRRVFDKLSGIGKTVVAFDFPGFGKSDPPFRPFSVFDYARVTLGLFSALGIEKPDVIAHSFGGRVAIILASENLVNRLLLVDAAGVKPRFNLGRSLKISAYKIRKKLGLKTDKCGSTDYRALDGVMRETFVKVVNEYLDRLLPLVTRPTLLVWGEKDRDTPPYMAKRMKRKIQDSALVIMKDCGHFSFLDDAAAFTAVASAFFGEEK